MNSCWWRGSLIEVIAPGLDDEALRVGGALKISWACADRDHIVGFAVEDQDVAELRSAPRPRS
ncbi:MAG: hypothetical protein MZV70_76110 [Desulfobacterales bacterium]|nr:hypothetical protein [Desulfobacterales bacterium]